MPIVDLSAPPLPDDELRERLRAAPWRRFATLGDSLVEGLGDSVPGYPDKAWPQAVGDALAELHPDFQFLNLGRRHLLAREVRETQLAAALEFRPDLASILCGGNDLLANPFEPQAVGRELETMVAALVDAGATVFLWSMLDVRLSGLYTPEAASFIGPRLAAMRDVALEVAERHDAIFFDYFNHDLGADRSIYSADLIHVNMRGQARFTEGVLQGLAAHVPVDAAS